jgi:outer membrane lipoprotein-sorting protein
MDAPTDGRRELAVLVVLVAVALAAVAGATAMDDGPDAETLLNESADRYADADSVVTTALVTASNDSATVTATVDVAAEGNRSRVVVTRGNDTYRAGSNGSVVWYATENRTAAWDHEVLEERAESHTNATPGAVLNRTRERYGNGSATVLRTESEDGTDAYVVKLTPGNESVEGNATLWIAKDDRRLLRAETTDGTNRTVVDFEDTSFNESIHDSTFDPPGDRVAVTDLQRYDSFDAVQSNTSLDLPALDATFREAGVVTSPDGVDVAQRYDAGGDNVTVVTTTVDRSFGADNATAVTVNGHDANVTSVEDRAVVYWTDDGVTTAVVVDGSEDRALELARRLEE